MTLDIVQNERKTSMRSEHCVNVKANYRADERLSLVGKPATLGQDTARHRHER